MRCNTKFGSVGAATSVASNYVTMNVITLCCHYTDLVRV